MIVNDFFQFLVVKRTTWEALNVDQWKKEATSIWSMKMETTAVIVERNILLKYICNVELNRQGIINNYCMRLSKISWFGSGFIIRSPSLFFDYWRSNLPFSRKSDGKKEKSVVSFTHGQNIICSQARLDDIALEQNIISCRQFHRRKTSDWSTRDHVTLPNSKWRQYLHRLFIPVDRRLFAA